MIRARCEHVGSLLRPVALREARARHAAGLIDDAELARVEDAAIAEALGMQARIGLDVVTDGEMRRLSFQSQMTEAVDGFGAWDLDAFLWGDWKSDRVGDERVERPPLRVVGKLARRRSLSGRELSYALGHTDRLVKVTLPSPSLFANFWDPRDTAGPYPSLERFLQDVTQILRQEVDELVALGAKYIQLDAPHYTLFVDETWRRFYASRGWPAERWLDMGVELDNAVIAGHPGVTFGFHLCRGNQKSRWLVSGGYDWLADRLLGRIAADRLLLEYDDDRSGSFAPLSKVPEDRIIVLGLLTTKSPELESVEYLTERIRQASLVVPLEQLALSPQCGFSTSVVGNALRAEDQWAKLARLVEVRRRVWRE